MGSLGDEAHQETINRIEDDIERYEEVFDWVGWRNRTTDQLLRWHVDKHEENLRKIDDCLLLLSDVLYKNTENGLAFKDVLHVRKACVSIAFQMDQTTENTESYAGVECWRAAGDLNEMNEIRNEWLW